MRRHFNQFLKYVRRIHMYTGLLLLPWVLLFGLSGLFFNHPTWMTPTDVVYQADRSAVNTATAFVPIDPDELAAIVIQQINQSGQASIKLIDSTPFITGKLNINATSDDASHIARINLVTGDATIESTPNKQVSTDKPAFVDSARVDPAIDMDKLRDGAGGLFKQAGVTLSSPLRVRSRPAPLLNFQVVDEAGRTWNTTFDLTSGRLDARAADAPTDYSLRNSLTQLHRLHQYPDALGVRWFWTLFADATALTMVFWGLSGALMWWQIKPTRLLGVCAVSVAVAMASVIIMGTVLELNFGPTSARRGGSGGNRGAVIDQPQEGMSQGESRGTGRGGGSRRRGIQQRDEAVDMFE